jgi:hypothetical protein
MFDVPNHHGRRIPSRSRQEYRGSQRTGQSFPAGPRSRYLDDGTLEISNNAAERWRQKSRSSRQLSS